MSNMSASVAVARSGSLGVDKGRDSLTFSWTLSRESGESTAKQMRITWESG